MYGEHRLKLAPTLGMCFLAVLLDGFDTSSIGVAGPAIAQHFRVPIAALTLPFLTTSVGAVFGYIASGYLAARWDARSVLIWSVVAFGVCSLATPLARSVEMLSILRFLTAIGLGTALPTAISIATFTVRPQLREAVTIFVATGLAGGGILGGALGGALTSSYGWQSLFYVGGALPLILAIALLVWLPSTATEARSTGAVTQEAVATGFMSTIRSLLTPALRVRTVGLWLFSFLTFADAYALLFWIPSLLVGRGLSQSDSQFAVAFFSFGGLAANLIMIPLARHFAVAKALAWAAIGAALCIAAVAMTSLTAAPTWMLITGVGSGLIVCTVGQSALAVAIYSGTSRTAGVGLSAAAGRIGSIFGPAVAGALVSQHWSSGSILLTAIGPIALAALLMAVFVGADRLQSASSLSMASGTTDQK